MPPRPLPPNVTGSAGPVDGVLLGPVEPETRELLDAASGGDRVLLRTLVVTGLSLGDLEHDGSRWRWGAPSRTSRLADLIEARSSGLADAQLAALRTLSEPWAKLYAAVARVSGDHETSDEPGAPPRLTDRERQVLALLAGGLTAGAIARRLYLSPRTVAKYQQRTYRKLGTSDRLTTVLRAQRLGLLEPRSAGR
jgi:DNA-binding NarL/FixJ family response regulator